MSGISSRKEYNSIDILKLFLAILVMVIHSSVDKTILSPLLRIAVPLFFIMSAYFFFSKIETLENGREKNAALGRLVKRNLLLYLFWSLIQLPIVMYSRGYFDHELGYGIWLEVKDVLLGNGFTGSWYIVALVIGTALVFLLSKKLGAGHLVLLTLPLYVLCCLLTNYRNLFDASSVPALIGDGFWSVTGLHFYTSFPVALFWVSVGRFLAEKKVQLTSKGLGCGVLILFSLLLALERYLIVRYGWAITDDCYFALALLCPTIFVLVQSFRHRFSTRFRLREMSVMLYVAHGCCGRVIGFLLKKLPFAPAQHELVKFALTFFVILCLTELLFFLKDRCGMKFLKYVC